MIYLSIYLLAALSTELVTYISSHFYNYTITNSGAYFTLFEVGLISMMLSNWNSVRRYTYCLMLLVYSLIWIVCMLATNGPWYNLLFGLSRLLLIIAGIYFLVESYIDNYPKWIRTIVVAFLLNQILTASIFAYMQFFIEYSNTNYINVYFLINAIANAALYTLITVGIIQCRKQLLQVS